MLTSMTGFATRTASIVTGGRQPATVTVSIKALNGRFFEVSPRVPLYLMHLEPEIIRLCRTKLHRGSITVHIAYSASDADTASVGVLSHTLVSTYLGAIKTLQKTYSVNGELTVGDLVPLLPQLVDFNLDNASPEITQKIVALVGETLASVEADRAREGESLETDLRERMAVIEREMQKLEPRAKELIAAKHADITNKATELMKTLAPENKDHAITGVYTQLERLDIHEELVRFASHLESLAATFAEKIPIKGKRIDFILQELFREINTITSKCSDSVIANHAILIKVELEKMREQVQNIV